MSLLMKALQQAAQNRSARPAGQSGDEPGSPAPEAAAGDPGSHHVSGASGSGRDAAETDAATTGGGATTRAPTGPAATRAPHASAPPIAELSLEPIGERPAARTPAAACSSADGASQNAAGHPPDGAVRFASDPSLGATVRAAGSQRGKSSPVSGASPAGAAPPPGAATRQYRRGAPRWSGDLQEDDALAAPDDPWTADPDATRRRGPARSDASPARAGSILAAGAGAAQAGAWSRVTRLQWIIAGGLAAGALLFSYFYVQISYPGLLQRGLRQPALSSPIVSRANPAAPVAPVSDPGIAAAAGQVTSGSIPLAAPPGLEAGARSTRGGSAVPGPAAGDGVPAALAASPLLSAPPAAASPLLSAQPASEASLAGSIGTPSAPPMRAPTSAPAPASTSASASASAPTSAPAAGATASGRSPAGRAGGPAAFDTALPALPASGAAASAPAPGAQAAPPARSADVAPVRAAPPAQAGDAIRVTRGSSAAPVDPALADAFDHMQAGRIESAQRLYSQTATAEPRNVDALLGLAAVAQLGNQIEAASRLWLRVLEIDPRNAHAQAALIGQLGRADPVAAESQLKTLIAREPSPFLYFTLGNLYAEQNRWAQAQQSWFQAHHLQPGNADYAFNLAIGLERIAQPRLAIPYLRTAIRLADAGARPHFDVAAARKRVALLEAAHGAP